MMADCSIENGLRHKVGSRMDSDGGAWQDHFGAFGGRQRR